MKTAVSVAVGVVYVLLIVYGFVDTTLAEFTFQPPKPFPFAGVAVRVTVAPYGTRIE